MTAVRVPAETRAEVLARDAYTCQRCGTYLGDNSRPYSLHHRRARGMGGSSDPRIHSPANLVTLCGSGTTGCHGWIEDHPIAARVTGWRLYSLDDLSRPIETYAGPKTLT